MGKRINAMGKKFGRLRVIEKAENKGKHTAWLCKCDCGAKKVVTTGHLTRKNNPVRSCGCLRREMASKCNMTHGKTHHPSYRTWVGMMDRCYDLTADSYKHYGGRGIFVCDRWHDVNNFITDMGERKDGYSIERINVNGNYEPKNCKWIRIEKQAQNKRNTIWVDGMCLAEWCREYSIPYLLAYKRLMRGWSLERVKND